MKTKYILKRSAVVAVAVVLFAGPTAVAQEYRVLHHFTGRTNDGSVAWGSLIGSSPVLYGMTCYGGGTSNGIVFRIYNDGTGFEVLHSFVSAATDGIWPVGSLILSDATLYGMATSAGSTNGGTVFRLGTNGAEFNVLRRFTVTDGMWPWGSLLQAGSVLYGLNSYGGSTNGWFGKGTAFSIDTNNGSQFQVLHTFQGGINDGISPHGTFHQSGSTLYATTLVGGSNNLGTLFKINLDGNGFQILHHFRGGANDGSRPYNVKLVQSGSTFYGTTEDGGSREMGAVFRMETDGTGFGLLHSFTGGDQGRKPFGSLILSGSTLYGLTSDEDTGTDGTIYSIQTNGADFRVLHRFQGSDGRDPCGSLWLEDGIAYGMTSAGGSNNLGVIFALDVRPKLSATLSDTNIIISWNTNYPGFALEIADQVAGPWNTLPVTTEYLLTFPITNDSQFFRLRK
jgi:uncharacterized repeat protein (TIGR03803 family)